MKNEYRLVVLSGPSGSGKDTVVGRLMRQRSDIALSVSCTTRNPREGEREGVDYHFLDEAQFEERIAPGKMLEYTRYAGHYYGTPMDEIERKLHDDTTVVLIIEVTGAKNVKRLCPDSLCIFLVPPSLEVLEQRLRARRTESEEQIRRRLGIAAQEMQKRFLFDHTVVNDVADECAREMGRIIDEWQEKYKDMQKTGKIWEKDVDEVQ